jgi:hypothetical protein
MFAKVAGDHASVGVEGPARAKGDHKAHRLAFVKFLRQGRGWACQPKSNYRNQPEREPIERHIKPILLSFDRAVSQFDEAVTSKPKSKLGLKPLQSLLASIMLLPPPSQCARVGKRRAGLLLAFHDELDRKQAYALLDYCANHSERLKQAPAANYGFLRDRNICRQ